MHSLVSLLKVLLAFVVAAGVTGASSPAPSPTATLQSGMEGSKAALVRIELVAVAEIAHIDASTGVAMISQGRSVVPLKSATGILLSADGVVATTWESLTVDEDAVAVYSANELFANVIHVPIVGNNGNPAIRGSTPDPHWGPHLQHCYKKVSHCILFRVPQYHVHTYTSKPGDVIAELLNKPSKPDDVALIRISGGGAAPTAALATTAAANIGGVLLGFTKRPLAAVSPAEFPATVDTAGNRIRFATDLAGSLRDGVAGGPVVDRATGQVLGLAGSRQPDGKATLVPAAAIKAALAKAGIQVSPSRFDAVFRRGIDHLAAGNQGGSAESALQESLTYFDSALARNRLAEARAQGATRAPASQAQTAEDAASAASLPGPLLAVLAGAVILAVIGVSVVLMRRRAAFATAPGAGGSPPVASGSGAPAPKPLRAGPLAPSHSRASVERTELTKVGDTDERAGPGKYHSGRTDAGEHFRPPQSPAAMHFATPPASGSGHNANDGARPGAGGTRYAGPLAPRAVSEVSAFCFRCGRQLQPEWQFCVGCGQRIG
ncbi:hypothetical protein G9E11_15105 [Arthrobacter sp. IA7]|uniref:zinc ribbon domain-containing protein n=1 Tax=Arthrobacter ipis TaxID=2716202 RepID=UPI001682D5D7|nr:zinc ribbon domain-containing protein [Arthrobacter ipis]MBD1543541.1 hypothetical protein [Arthrobacter ipis]